MSTSAEQLHQGKINMEPKKGSDVRLFIDLDVCSTGECRECEIQCSYFYHTANNGVVSIAELATYFLVCRRCEDPHCVSACPVEALEQQTEKDKLLIRHNMRCMSLWDHLPGKRSLYHTCVRFLSRSTQPGGRTALCEDMLVRCAEPEKR